MWNYQLSTKTKKNKLGTKKALFGPLAGMLNNCCHICNQRPPIFLIAKFREKIAISKFGNKNVLFGCFGQQFWNAIVIFVMRALEFALLQSLVQKIKALKFGTKNALFGCFWAGIWKRYCHIWNQHPWFFLTAKLREIKKKPKIATKNASFGYF